MAHTVVSNLMFTTCPDAISASMAAHQQASTDPDFLAHKEYIRDLRFRQMLRSCNDGNPNSPRYVG